MFSTRSLKKVAPFVLSEWVMLTSREPCIRTVQGQDEMRTPLSLENTSIGGKLAITKEHKSEHTTVSYQEKEDNVSSFGSSTRDFDWNWCRTNVVVLLPVASSNA